LGCGGGRREYLEELGLGVGGEMDVRNAWEMEKVGSGGSDYVEGGEVGYLGLVLVEIWKTGWLNILFLPILLELAAELGELPAVDLYHQTQ
jgi:hypothetical protein